MFNPFHPFTIDLLEAYVGAGKRYFVRQRFNRAINTNDHGVKGYFLISPYELLTTAQDHLGAIAYDPLCFLYYWEDIAHQERLRLAASMPEGYKIFSPVFRPDWEKGITDRLKGKAKRYVADLGWTPKAGEMVNTNYEVQFGELFIRLTYKGRQVKVKFEEIEMLS
jgi:hypothetical protein